MLSTQYRLATKRTGECPICLQVDKGCKIDLLSRDQLILCRKVELGHRQDGFISLKETANGVWRIFKVGYDSKAAWTEEQVEARRVQRERAQLDREYAAEQERKRMVVSSVRNAETLEYMRNHPLAPEHRQQLIDKGHTEESIAFGEAFSGWAGFAFPVIDLHGNRMLGQQRTPEGHKWIFRNQNKRHETGQQALSIFGNRTNPERVVLVDSISSKVSKTAYEHPEWLVAGASGGTFSISSKEVAELVHAYPNTPFSWLPDGGCLTNNNVMRQIESTYEMFLRLNRVLDIGWWGLQIEKGGTDIDEIDPNTPIEWISYQKLVSFSKVIIKAERGIYVGRGAKADRGSLENSFNKLIEAVKPVECGVKEYSNSRELKAILEQAIRDDVQYVHDKSECGSGKSHGLGGMENPSEIKQLIYVNNNHRKPTTQSIEESMADVPSRHDGLYVNPDRKTPLGNDWLQTTQPDGAEWERTRSNCHLAEEQRKWAATGYGNDDEKNPICHSCEHKSSCALSSGDGYGYIHQKGGALSNARVAIAPAAMPPHDKHDYSKTVIVLDDQPITIYKELSVTYTQIRQTIGEIAMTEGGSDLLEELELITVPIQRALETPEFHGYRHSAIFGDLELPNAESLLNRVMAIIRPNPLNLVHKGNEGKANKLAQYGFKSPSKPRLEDVVQNWLGQILEIFAGKVDGAVSIRGNTLTVKHKNTEHADIMKKCKLNLIMDATTSTEDLAKAAGVDVNKFLVISQPRATFENETMHMVVGMGSPTKQRADSMNGRIAALEKSVAALCGSCKTIDHVKGIDRFLWHRDSVGSNIFKDDHAILLIGKPVPNMGAVADEYYFLTGIRVDATDKDPEYQAFLHRKVAGACIQAVSRLRAQHRPDKELHIYIVSDREDYPIAEVMSAHSGAKLVVESIEDICIEAAGAVDRAKIAIARAIEANPKITMVQLANETGKAVSTIKGYFRDYGLGYKKGMTLLYKSLIAKSSLLDSDYANWKNLLSQEYVDTHIVLLDAYIPEESKAVEVASRVESLTQQQLSALFAAIGTEATSHTIELLVLNLYLQVPEMKLSKNGDSIEEIVEGLRSIAQRADMDGLELLRAAHADDKEALQYAASVVKKECEGEFEILKDLTIMANKVNALRLAREAV
ncbi:MAG: hypothetical protein ACEQSC_00070 [Candidatus Nanopelagicaceae bacterium]